MDSIVVVPLSDGRLQFFYSDDAGNVFTKWKVTTDVNADWSDWQSWPAPGKIGAGARLSDRRLQLWTIDGNWTAWKKSSDPNSDWIEWQSFPPLPLSSGDLGTRRIAAVSTQAGGLSLFLLDNGGMWTTSKVTSDPNAEWTPWSALPTDPSRFRFVEFAAAQDHDGRLIVFGISARLSASGETLWQTQFPSQGGGSYWDEWVPARFGYPPGAAPPLVRIYLAALSDGRLQAWGVGAGFFTVHTCLETASGTRDFRQWDLLVSGIPFPPPKLGMSLKGSYQLAFGQLTNGQLQVWVVGENPQRGGPAFLTTWQTNNDPNAPEWGTWQLFPLPQ